MINIGILSLRRFSDTNHMNHLRRFYKECRFDLNHKKAHQLHNYLITLDHKSIKTPYHHILAVPSRPLAFLICCQFNRQHKHIKTSQMPILSLCRTAVDVDLNGNLSHHLKHSVFEYLKTDTLLFTDWNYQKHHQQIALPLIKSFCEHFEMEIPVSDSLHPPNFKINQKFIRWVDSLNNWQLIGLQTMTIWLKSAISAWSVIGKKISVKQARIAATLEETVQIAQNGEVEEMDMNYNQIELMVSCGEMMFRYGNSDK